GRRPSLRDELLVTLPLVVASLAIARLVGADPRTQLLIVPLAAFYAAWGIARIGDLVDHRSRGSLRPGFVTRAAVFVVSCALLSTIARWVYMGHAMGSPHHSIGAENREVGKAVAAIIPEEEPLMSWHPAHALYADREWRVLPYAT